jgi:alkanesulfonate monooxygenase SsuD/methylene tetrahydromethanopterin reductase-like flavin-dependent oxidoreductase (luciferase family)
MRTELVLSPFDASSSEMLSAARIADQGGFDAVWTFDHFSGIVAEASWSRDPFVTLGAIAATTNRVRIGVLVANIANRPPAQLASALNTLQSMAPGRVVAGIGAGAGAGGRFAAEQEAVGRPLLTASARRQALVDYVSALTSIWSQDQTNSALDSVIDRAHPRPPLVVGASGPRMIDLAVQIADGVNIRAGKALEAGVAAAREAQPSPDFEISVFDRLDLHHPLGGEQDYLEHLEVTARTLVINAPYDLDKLRAIADRLAGGSRFTH